MITELLMAMWLESVYPTPPPIDLTNLPKRVQQNKPLKYNPYDLTVSSNLTEKHICRMLKGTRLASLATSYLEAEKTYNVNAYFLIGLTIQESGWGNSNFARTRNNVTGYCAYTNKPNDAMYFPSRHDCIMRTARHIKKSYLTKGGSYYEGTSIWNVNANYSISGWAESINKIITYIKRLDK